MKVRLTKLVACIAAALGMLFWSVPPASAHAVTSAWGYGQYDVLSTSLVNTGNQVGMWQAFLFSYNQIACSKFDGVFGPATRQGTMNLQAFWGISSDGIVGQNTWRTAFGWLYIVGDDGFTTQFRPAYAHRGLLNGLGRFGYPYGGAWNWNAAGEVPYSRSVPNGRFSSNHPGISFSMACHPSDG